MINSLLHIGINRFFWQNCSHSLGSKYIVLLWDFFLVVFMSWPGVWLGRCAHRRSFPDCVCACASPSPSGLGAGSWVLQKRPFWEDRWSSGHPSQHRRSFPAVNLKKRNFRSALADEKGTNLLRLFVALWRIKKGTNLLGFFVSFWRIKKN